MTTFKEFTDLPVVKPATAGRDFQDQLLKRTHQTPQESERLYNILGHYEKNLEAEIAAEEAGVFSGDANDEVQI